MGIHYPPAMASSSVLPDWALIDRYVFERHDDTFPADDPTEASCINSRGDQIRVCIQLREPPQPSRLYLWWPGGTEQCDRFSVVGAHRDAVLFQMAYLIPVPNHECPRNMYDYFLYRAGGGSPSMVRLPSVDGTIEEFRTLFENGSFHSTSQQLRRLEGLDIAVLRRGAEDVAVAELQIVRTLEPELHVLFPSTSSSSKWLVKKPRIIHGPDMDLENLLWHWFADVVVPFGNYLCWVDFCQGAVFLCKVFDDDPELYYLALPAKIPYLDQPLGRLLAGVRMTLCVCEEQGVMKCVRVLCSNGLHQWFIPPSSFVATSWTLEITKSHELIWKEDGEVKSDDFWQLHGTELFPRTQLEYPLVSLKDPKTIYFVLRKEAARVDELGYDYDETWLVSVDMCSFSVKKSFQYVSNGQEGLSDEETMFVKEKFYNLETFIPAEFSKFLKMHSTSEPKQLQGSMILDMAFGRHGR